MIRKIFIGIGVTILAILLSAWLYLLLFGTPQGVNDVFTDLGLRGGPTEITPVVDPETITNLAISTGQLAQLTTKAVAGFVHTEAVEASTSTPARPERLIYAERGTGHIYEINLTDNTEGRISGTTVGQTVKAVFSPNGGAVVLQSEKGDTTTASIYLLGANTTRTLKLPDNSSNFYFATSSTLYYSVSENGVTTAYAKDLTKEIDNTLWSVPFIDINIAWTNKGDYVINRTSPWLKSGVYLVKNGKLNRVIEPQHALSATIEPSGRHVLYSAFNNEAGQVVSYMLDTDNNVTIDSVLLSAPEKCTYVAESNFWCANSIRISNGNLEVLNQWYRGEFVSSDTLWSQTADGGARHISYLAEIAGFDIDVTELKASTNGDKLFFRNKVNDALWVYRVGE